MFMKHGFLEMLCCPVDRAPLRMMSPGELADLNTMIALGEARDACGEPVGGAFDDASCFIAQGRGLRGG